MCCCQSVLLHWNFFCRAVMIATDLAICENHGGRKRYALKRMFFQHPALEREDVCHQVGFGRWSTLCNSRSVWLFKSLKSRVQWFEIGMSVRSQNSEYVVRCTSRLKLEPRESRRRSVLPATVFFFCSVVRLPRRAVICVRCVCLLFFVLVSA